MDAHMREQKALRLRQAQVKELVQILETEHLGRANATTNARLAARMGMQDRGSAGRPGNDEEPEAINSRELTNIIQFAREQGYPIAADNNGIYMPRTAEEFEATIALNDRRAQTYSYMANMARRAASIFFGGDRRAQAKEIIPSRGDAPEVNPVTGEKTFLRMTVETGN
jgi:hypothetical protein